MAKLQRESVIDERGFEVVLPAGSEDLTDAEIECISNVLDDIEVCEIVRNYLTDHLASGLADDLVVREKEDF